MMRAANPARLLARLQGLADVMESSQHSASFVSDALRLAAGSCLSQGTSQPSAQPSACTSFGSSSSARQPSGGAACAHGATSAFGSNQTVGGFGIRRFATGHRHGGQRQHDGGDEEGVIELVADEEVQEAVGALLSMQSKMHVVWLGGSALCIRATAHPQFAFMPPI